VSAASAAHPLAGAFLLEVPLPEGLRGFHKSVVMAQRIMLIEAALHVHAVAVRLVKVRGEALLLVEDGTLLGC